jgi:hypothetical protein
MFELNQLVILKDDQLNNIYKIKNISNGVVDLIGYNIRTKLKISIDKLNLSTYYYKARKNKSNVNCAL